MTINMETKEWFMSTIKSINILIPTYNRLEALAITLTSLYYQSEKSFDILIADQSQNDRLEKDKFHSSHCTVI